MAKHAMQTLKKVDPHLPDPVGAGREVWCFVGQYVPTHPPLATSLLTDKVLDRNRQNNQLISNEKPNI
jgi:hypothetical protein